MSYYSAFESIKEDRLKLLNSILEGKQNYDETVNLTDRELNYLMNNGWCGFCRKVCTKNHYVNHSIKGY